MQCCITNTDSDKSECRVANNSSHFSNLPVLAFSEFDADPTGRNILPETDRWNSFRDMRALRKNFHPGRFCVINLAIDRYVDTCLQSQNCIFSYASIDLYEIFPRVIEAVIN